MMQHQQTVYVACVVNPESGLEEFIRETSGEFHITWDLQYASRYETDKQARRAVEKFVEWAPEFKPGEVYECEVTIQLKEKN